MRVFHGSADEEVSPRRCASLVDKSRARGSDITITIYPGATHDFDDPGESRQGVEANADALRDVVPQATNFFAGLLKK